MQNIHVLVGCIDRLDNTISTRFFYVNKEEGIVKDVTENLCEGIDAYNEEAQKIRDVGTYAMIIPYDYKYGLANYSFGCGLSHYLQEKEFVKIEEAVLQKGMELSFPLAKCTMSMYTPHDISHILSCKGVFDRKIKEALIKRHGVSHVA